MIFKKVSSIALLFMLINSQWTFGMQMENIVPVVNQEELANYMQKLYGLLIPEYKKVLKKFYYEIDWAKKEYILDRAKGDKILAEFYKEFTRVIKEQMDPMLAVVIEEIRTKDFPQEFIEEFKGAFKTMMFEMIPVMVDGLKRGIEMESEVYQEIMKEKKEQESKDIPSNAVVCVKRK